MYKIGMSIGLFIISVMLIAGLALSLVACTTEEDIANARAREADAAAREAMSKSQGTVNVLREQSNIHIEELQTQFDLYKQRVDFELAMDRKRGQLHREEMASIVEEGQVLIVALKENRAIAENSRAAAENSFWVLILGVPLVGMNLGLVVFVIFLVLRQKSV